MESLKDQYKLIYLFIKCIAVFLPSVVSLDNFPPCSHNEIWYTLFSGMVISLTGMGNALIENIICNGVLWRGISLFTDSTIIKNYQIFGHRGITANKTHTSSLKTGIQHLLTQSIRKRWFSYYIGLPLVI
jgi:hypothetical protein